MSHWLLDRIYSKMDTGVSIDSDWEEYKRQVDQEPKATKVMIYFGVWRAAYYRVFTPFMQLAKDPKYDIRISAGPLWSAEDIEWADVVLFYRIADPRIVAEAKKIKGSKGIWFDTDDYMHGIPPYHESYTGVANSRHLQCMDEICDMADVMTVSTKYLKKLYQKRYRTKIEVLPNCVRKDDYSISKHSMGRDCPYIAWAGSVHHDEDLRQVVPELKELVRKGAKLLTVNYIPQQQKDVFESIPREKRLHIVGTHPHLVSSLLNLADVAIAPLVDNEFNRAKSNVKFLESGMLGIPLVASALEPYLHDWEITKATTDWTEKIWKAKAYGRIKDLPERVLKKYSIQNHAHKWKTLIERIKK